MTESKNPKHPLTVLNEIENHTVNSAFEDIMTTAFPNDLKAAEPSIQNAESVDYESDERRIHTISEAILKRAFSEGFSLTETNEQPSLSPKATKGTDLAIAQASSLEQRELNEANQQEQLTSKLTGMPNREAFVEWLDREIASHPSQKLTVGFLDMDKLKTINDTYGHELADQVIQRIGKILSSGVRSSEDMIAAHRSGDEFLIGINGANPDRINEFTHSALHAINRLYIRKNPDGHSEIIEINPDNTSIDRNGLHQVGASMGFASMHEGMDASQLMAAADQAMYQAKEAGRNRIVISE